MPSKLLLWAGWIEFKRRAATSLRLMESWECGLLIVSSVDLEIFGPPDHNGNLGENRPLTADGRCPELAKHFDAPTFDTSAMEIFGLISLLRVTSDRLMSVQRHSKLAKVGQLVVLFQPSSTVAGGFESPAPRFDEIKLKTSVGSDPVAMCESLAKAVEDVRSTWRIARLDKVNRALGVLGADDDEDDGDADGNSSDDTNGSTKPPKPPKRAEEIAVTPAVIIEASEVLWFGWLWKKHLGLSGGMLDRWHARFFVVAPHCIEHFRSSAANKMSQPKTSQHGELLDPTTNVRDLFASLGLQRTGTISQVVRCVPLSHDFRALLELSGGQSFHLDLSSAVHRESLCLAIEQFEQLRGGHHDQSSCATQPPATTRSSASDGVIWTGLMEVKSFDDANGDGQRCRTRSVTVDGWARRLCLVTASPPVLHLFSPPDDDSPEPSLSFESSATVDESLKALGFARRAAIDLFLGCEAGISKDGSPCASLKTSDERMYLYRSKSRERVVDFVSAIETATPLMRRPSQAQRESIVEAAVRANRSDCLLDENGLETASVAAAGVPLNENFSDVASDDTLDDDGTIRDSSLHEEGDDDEDDDDDGTIRDSSDTFLMGNHQQSVHLRAVQLVRLEILVPLSELSLSFPFCSVRWHGVLLGRTRNAHAAEGDNSIGLFIFEGARFELDVPVSFIRAQPLELEVWLHDELRCDKDVMQALARCVIGGGVMLVPPPRGWWSGEFIDETQRILGKLELIVTQPSAKDAPPPALRSLYVPKRRRVPPTPALPAPPPSAPATRSYFSIPRMPSLGFSRRGALFDTDPLSMMHLTSTPDTTKVTVLFDADANSDDGGDVIDDAPMVNEPGYMCGHPRLETRARDADVVLRLTVERVSDVPPAPHSHVHDCFIMIELDALQVEGTVVRDNCDPVWSPPDEFLFPFPNGLPRAEIKPVASLMDWDGIWGSTALGVARLNLSKMALGARSTPLAVPLADANNGGRMATTLHLRAKLMRGADLDLIVTTRVFEYQLYTAYEGWGSLGLDAANPLKTEGQVVCMSVAPAFRSRRPRFTLFDGTPLFGDRLTVAAPPVRDKYVVSRAWALPSGRGDTAGWTYASSYEARAWYDEPRATSFSRRRLWVRQTHAPQVLI